MPIIILYFLLNNLTYTEIGILAAVMSITTVLTEVHGGAFADLYGKKSSLILHSIFGGLTMFFYYIGNSLEIFLLGSIAYGIALAFASGTKKSLLYDTLVQLKDTKSYKKYSGRVMMYSYTFNALVLLSIPVIYTFNPKLPFLIGIGFFLISLVVASFFVEPPLTKKTHKTLTAFNIKIKDAINEIVTKQKVISVFLLTMFIFGFSFMVSEFKQPLMLISGLDIIYFGIIYALMRIIAGFSAGITHKMEEYMSSNWMVVSAIALFGLSFLTFWIGSGYVILGAVLLLSFSGGFARIVLDDEMNKNIKSDQRTTIFSLLSLTRELFTGAIVIVFGYTADLIGIQGMFGYVTLSFAVIGVLLYLYVRES